MNLDIIKFLGFEQIFKNALTGLPIGGGKGGSDFDPKGRSDAEVMRFCQSFMTELYRYLGEYTDVPAGDIGVGEREIGYLFGQYKRLTNRYESGVLTGKGLGWGGSPVRKRGDRLRRGLLRRRDAAHRGRDLDGPRFVVSGSGNVAHLHHREDQRTRRPRGRLLGFGRLRASTRPESTWPCWRLRKRRAAASTTYAEARGAAAPFQPAGSSGTSGATRLPLRDAERADGDDAQTLLRNGVPRVAEGRQHALHPGGGRGVPGADVLFGPARPPTQAASPPALEMQQNASPRVLDVRAGRRAPAEMMQDIYDRCREAADAYDVPGDYVAGANIGGFIRVADAMSAFGVI